MKNINWALLISGWGRSALKTLELYEEKRLQNNKISLIICESSKNGINEIANRLGIPVVMIQKGDFERLNEYYTAINTQFQKHNIDYLFLLGYKHIIKEPLLSTYNNRIVNIHPSILPSFRGKKAIQQALDYGVKVSGITTHFIDEEVDRGIILCQRCIKIEDQISFEELDLKFVEEGKLIIEETFQKILKLHE